MSDSREREVSKYLLKFSKEATDDAIQYSIKQLKAHSFFVDTNHIDDERIIIVSPSSTQIAQTAERVGLIKQLRSSEHVEAFKSENGSKYKMFNKHQLFTPAEEIWLLYHAMQQTSYQERYSNHDKGFLSWLLSGKHPIVEEAFPLHTLNEKKTLSTKLKSSLLPWRQVDVNAIRNYFGEEMAFYFAWMNFYSKFLIFPAFFGILMYLCRPKDGSVDTDAYLPIYSVLLSIWAILFMRYWQRQSAVHSLHWNTYKLSQADEQRPEFHGVTCLSPVTDKPTLYYPSWKRRLWYVFSLLVMIPLLSLGVCAMTLSLNLNGYVKNTQSPIYVQSLANFAKPGAIFAADSPYFGWLVPTILHSIVISVINTLYSKISEYCTDLENHKTIQDWHTSLVIKRVLFECFDCYMPLFYIAFYQLDVVTLRTEIVSLFMSDEIRRILLESVIPFLKEVLMTRKLIQKNGSKSPLPTDIVFADYDLYDDYVEMVIQFGYITLFAAAFPLGPAITLLFVYTELRSDLFKILYAYRRPHPRRAKGIGVWLSVMNTMVFVSILTNCAILGFSSEQLMQWLPWMFDRDQSDGDQVLGLGRGRYIVGIVFGAEHLMLLAALFLQWAISPVPKSVRIAISRRKYHAKQQMLLPEGKKTK